MPSNIPAQRVPVIDQKTGLVALPWYDFFQNLFNLTGGGSNTVSLTDLQLAPPVVPAAPAATVAAVTGKFFAYKGSFQSLNTGMETGILWPDEVYDVGSVFNTSTHRFETDANSAGEWIVTVAVRVTSQSDGNNTRLELYKNGSIYAILDGKTMGAAGACSLQGSIPLTMAAGDYVTIAVYSSGSAAATFGPSVSYFTGLKIR